MIVTRLIFVGKDDLQCHRLVLLTSDVEELKQKEENLDSLASTSETDAGNEAVDWLCNV